MQQWQAKTIWWYINQAQARRVEDYVIITQIQTIIIIKVVMIFIILMDQAQVMLLLNQWEIKRNLLVKQQMEETKSF